MKSLDIRALIMSLVIAVLSFLAGGIQSQDKAKTAIRVLVVTGGHDFEKIPFFDMFKRFEGIDFKEASHPSADSLLNPGLLKSFDAVVFYDMPREPGSEKSKTDFIELLNRGIGVVFLHHSLASYQDTWDGFKAILGGKYHEKAGEKNGKPVEASSYLEGVDVPVHVVNAWHPVTEGIEDFILHDEVYGNFEVLPDVHPLLETGHPKSTRTIGWWHSYGNSRIVYLQPGHDRFAYEDSSYRKLVYQAIRFVSRKSFEPVSPEMLTDWKGAGLLPGTPSRADAVFDVTKEPGTNWDEKVGSAVQKAKDGPGLSVVRFPAGTYRLGTPVILSGSASGGIVFQGAGVDSTILEFTLGREGTCFNAYGNAEGSKLALDQDFEKGKRSFSATGLSDRFSENDWVMLCEAGFPDADPGNVGQIMQLAGIDGGRGVFRDEAAKTYLKSNTLWILKVSPIQNVGFENFTLRRMDGQASAQNAYDGGMNFKFNYAANCWIKGVKSVNTCRHHVVINRSAHLEISGCYFGEACSRDENSYGYGLLMEVCTNHCLIQNNIFQHLRHSMTLCEGVNGNVFTYNYSRDQNWKFHGFPNPFQGADLCLHGRYPYANLFEQNVVEFAYADNSHGANGPYNVFLRNQVYHGFKGKGKIRIFKSPYTVLLGNMSTSKEAAQVQYDKSEPFSDVFSLQKNGLDRHDHRDFRSRKMELAETRLPVISLYYRNRPGFLDRRYTWPTIGPSPDRWPLTQSIPAKDRYFSGILTVSEKTDDLRSQINDL